MKPTGPTRSLQTGSVRKRCPSISSRIAEWPSHVTRSPEAGGLAKRPGWTGTVLGGDSGVTWGSVLSRWPMAAQVSLTIGCGFSKWEPCHSGDFFIRSSRGPVARAPRGAQDAVATAPSVNTNATPMSRRRRRFGRRALRLACSSDSTRVIVIAVVPCLRATGRPRGHRAGSLLWLTKRAGGEPSIDDDRRTCHERRARGQQPQSGIGNLRRLPKSPHRYRLEHARIVRACSGRPAEQWCVDQPGTKSIDADSGRRILDGRCFRGPDHAVLGGTVRGVHGHSTQP